MEEIRFESITPQEVPVVLGGKKYLLKETTGDAAVKWQNAQAACFKIVDGKAVAQSGLADTNILLLSCCLFEDDGGSVVKNVPPGIIKSWPDRVQKLLVTRLKEISGLEIPETIEALEAEKKSLETRLEALKAQQATSKN